MPSRRIATLDLFSGIGGFSLALRSICKTVGYCEKKVASVAVLKARMKSRELDKAPVFDDVNDLTKAHLNELPLMITAGFPCQDISGANPSGKGLDGERSGLFFQIIRLIDEIPEVKIVLLENSPFIRTRGLQRVIDCFVDRGFRLAFSVYTPADIGAPHDRRRWICLAVQDVATLPICQYVFDTNEWRTEPCPRVLRTQKNKARSLKVRNMLIGDSVVPIVVSEAFNDLSAIILNKKRSADFYPAYVVAFDKQLRVMSPKRSRNAQDLKLVLTNGQTSFKRKLWASPCASHWSQYENLSLRSTRVLANQIYYERRTREYMGPLSPHSTKHSGVWSINPCFVEWLMGFPKDWTLTKAAKT